MFESACRLLARMAAVIAGASLIGCAAPGRTVMAHQYRIARPTARLDELVRFYQDGLGLPILGRFQGHAGYDGVMIGLPDAAHHLEFTRQPGGHAGPSPTAEHLLVLYIADRGVRDRMVARLEAMGFSTVPPENPYWIGKAITIPDPDGWRVVLFHGGWRPDT